MAITATKTYTHAVPAQSANTSGGQENAGLVSCELQNDKLMVHARIVVHLTNCKCRGCG